MRHVPYSNMNHAYKLVLENAQKLLNMESEHPSVYSQIRRTRDDLNEILEYYDRVSRMPEDILSIIRKRRDEADDEVHKYQEKRKAERLHQE